MPRTAKKYPDVGQAVRFRLKGDTKIWKGTYTDDGFQVCSGFICYKMPKVDYWQPEDEEAV